jgi:hypothetical protein
MLIASKADVNQSTTAAPIFGGPIGAGLTPLLNAARGETTLVDRSWVQKELPEVVMALIEADADIDAAEYFNGQTSLYLTVDLNNVETARLLLAAGADINYKSNRESQYHRVMLGMGPSPLELAKRMVSPDASALEERATHDDYLEDDDFWDDEELPEELRHMNIHDDDVGLDAAKLVILAAEPWSPQNATLFPPQDRQYATELMRLCWLLVHGSADGEKVTWSDGKPRVFANHQQGALIDAWRAFIIPLCVERSAQVPAPRSLPALLGIAAQHRMTETTYFSEQPGSSADHAHAG